MMGVSVVLWLLAGEPALSVRPDPQSIAGGVEARTCQWPTAVTFRSGGVKCTGALVHPEVVVTAAHCLAEKVGDVRFGENFLGDAMKIEPEMCFVHPDYVEDPHPRHDIGVCRLTEPVEGIPPTPLLVGCEQALNDPQTTAAIVGFGPEEQEGQFGDKRWAFTSLAGAPRPDELIEVGEAMVGGCLGDSGGPLYVRHPDGSWRVAGVLVYGPPCGEGPSLYLLARSHVGWMESRVDLDLTPCHGPAGDWAPDARCGAFAIDPTATGAVWADRCAGELSESSFACEPWADDTTDGSSGSSGTRSSGSGDPMNDGEDEGCDCRSHPSRGSLVPCICLCLTLRRRPRSRGRADDSRLLLQCRRPLPARGHTAVGHARLARRLRPSRGVLSHWET